MKFGESFLRCRQLLGVLVCCLLFSGALKADEVKLMVNLTDVSEAAGNLRVSLYREPETFRKEERAFKVISIPARKGDVQLVFAGLPAGRYALMAYHDENGDGKLNLRFGMFPSEGYGLSNNPTVVGPPKFADSVFDVTDAETSISIRMSY